MVNVDKEDARQLWDWLAQRQVSKIRKAPWVTLDRNKEKDWIMLPTRSK